MQTFVNLLLFAILLSTAAVGLILVLLVMNRRKASARDRALRSHERQPSSPQEYRETATEGPQVQRRSKGMSIGQLEWLVGRHWTTWIGVFAIFIGVSLGIRYAIIEGLIGPLYRFLFGLLLSWCLVLFGDQLLKGSQRNLGRAFIALGLGFAEFTIYAGFDMTTPPLYGQVPAFVMMLIVGLIGCLLAFRHDAQPIAALSLLFALATPALVSTGIDKRDVLFTYLTLWGIGTSLICYFKGWRSLAWIMILGGWIYAIGWYLEFGDENPPLVVLAWQSVFAIILVLPVLIGLWRDTTRKYTQTIGPIALHLGGYHIACLLQSDGNESSYLIGTSTLAILLGVALTKIAKAVDVDSKLIPAMHAIVAVSLHIGFTLFGSTLLTNAFIAEQVGGQATGFVIGQVILCAGFLFVARATQSKVFLFAAILATVRGAISVGLHPFGAIDHRGILFVELTFVSRLALVSVTGVVAAWSHRLLNSTVSKGLGAGASLLGTAILWLELGSWLERHDFAHLVASSLVWIACVSGLIHLLWGLKNNSNIAQNIGRIMHVFCAVLIGWAGLVLVISERNRFALELWDGASWTIVVALVIATILMNPKTHQDGAVQKKQIQIFAFYCVFTVIFAGYVGLVSIRLHAPLLWRAALAIGVYSGVFVALFLLQYHARFRNAPFLHWLGTLRIATTTTMVGLAFVNALSFNHPGTFLLNPTFLASALTMGALWAFINLHIKSEDAANRSEDTAPVRSNEASLYAHALLLMGPFLFHSELHRGASSLGISDTVALWAGVVWILCAWIGGALWNPRTLRYAKDLSVAMAIFGGLLTLGSHGDTRPFLNAHFCAAACSIALMNGLSANLSRRARILDRTLSKQPMMILGIATVGIGWMLISQECWVHAQNLDQKLMLYSISWSIYAAALLVVGFVRRIRAVRIFALVLFGFVVGKVTLIDIIELPDPQRIFSFIALGSMLIGASWLYNRLEHEFFDAQEDES